MLTESFHIRGMFIALMLTLPSALYAADVAPTLKDVVEKQDVEKVSGKVETLPVKGPYDEFGHSTPRSSTMHLARALTAYDFDTVAN